jgi:hypothetical protein
MVEIAIPWLDEISLKMNLAFSWIVINNRQTDPADQHHLVIVGHYHQTPPNSSSFYNLMAINPFIVLETYGELQLIHLFVGLPRFIVWHAFVSPLLNDFT